MEALRDMEKKIDRDLLDGIDTASAHKTSLDDYFREYIEERTLQPSTRTNYKYMYGKYISGALGKKKLQDIKYSDIKRLYNGLIDTKQGIVSSILCKQLSKFCIVLSAIKLRFDQVYPVNDRNLRTFAEFLRMRL